MYFVKCWLDDLLKGKGETCWHGRMKKNKPGKRSVTSWFQRMQSSDSNASLPHSISHSHVTSSASVSWIWYGSNHISNVEVCCQLGTEIPELQHLKVLKFWGKVNCLGYQTHPLSTKLTWFQAKEDWLKPPSNELNRRESKRRQCFVKYIVFPVERHDSVAALYQINTSSK